VVPVVAKPPRDRHYNVLFELPPLPCCYCSPRGAKQAEHTTNCKTSSIVWTT